MILIWVELVVNLRPEILDSSFLLRVKATCNPVFHGHSLSFKEQLLVGNSN